MSKSVVLLSFFFFSAPLCANEVDTCKAVALLLAGAQGSKEIIVKQLASADAAGNETRVIELREQLALIAKDAAKVQDRILREACRRQKY